MALRWPRWKHTNRFSHTLALTTAADVCALTLKNSWSQQVGGKGQQRQSRHGLSNDINWQDSE
jgi:hypothetical protein